MTSVIADRRDLLTGGFVSLVATIIAAAIFIFSPFAHGGWLIAYLGLVGFAAQVLLGAGQAALLAASASPSPSPGARLAQAGFWNVGVVAVPAGVLTETRALVVAGSVSLTAALISFLWSVRPSLGPGRTWLTRSYAGLLAGLMASVLVGTALARDLPWT
jgi:hypothetical protein